LKEDFGKVLNEDGNRIIATIQNNAINMGRLIDDLLAFSRLGRQELHKIEIDMSALVNVVLNDISKTITHNAEIKVSKLHDIKGDYNLLQQAFFNLMANAVKFSSKKEHPIVEVFSEETKKEIIYTIKDNGVGFNMDYVNKLFIVFQRLHAQEEFEGTGVGLAIVQRVVLKHGGKVWAEGKPDKGATFKISLPKTNKR
jgi:light-regulated signal transduction histidine kinase (bacteriophytochrome)